MLPGYSLEISSRITSDVPRTVPKLSAQNKPNPTSERVKKDKPRTRRPQCQFKHFHRTTQRRQETIDCGVHVYLFTRLFSDSISSRIYKDDHTNVGTRQNLNMFNLNIKIYKTLRIHGYSIDKKCMSVIECDI
jgi:hypothetical protein